MLDLTYNKTDSSRIEFLEQYIFEFKPAYYDGSPVDRIYIDLISDNSDFVQSVDNYINKIKDFDKSQIQDEKDSVRLEWLKNHIEYFPKGMKLEKGHKREYKESYFSYFQITWINNLRDLIDYNMTHENYYETTKNYNNSYRKR